MISLLLFSGMASAEELPTVFAEAAEEYRVPEKILLALAYEASHWRPDAVSAWNGYGLFDFQEDDSGPNIESASMISGVDPDAIITDPVANTRAAASLLAWQARLSNDGQLPETDDLLSWWNGVRAFSGSHSPVRQDRFAGYIYELINFGVELDVESGLFIEAEPVDHWSRVPIMPPDACDYSGCDQWVSASSSNYSDYSREASDIDYVVIHTVQGSYDGCISWFQNSSASVSAHYVVRSSDGAVTQMVAEEDVAWHAGNWSYNLASVGIEHEGYVDQPEVYYTDAMYQGSADLTADIADRNGITLDRDHIIGHSEVPSATHTDPGDGWDWDYYMELVGGSTGGGSGGGGGDTSTGNLIGVIADSDIYNGDRLVGATVWIAETGETVESEADGYYHFYDLALDSYTVHACMDGFAEATCSKSISTGDNWCSIALPVGDGDCSLYEGGDDGGDSGDDGGGGVDTALGDTGEDGGTGTAPSPSHSGGHPGDAVGMWETRGCATAGTRGLAPVLGSLIGLLALARRRKG
jgi:hypothetical protein